MSSRRPLPEWLAVMLVFGTSAAVLVLEILAGRLLAPYVGVSLDTFTGIIGTILAGIALGAWAGGTLADRVDPRQLLPILLVGGGALAIATIPIVRVLGDASGAGGGARILLLTACGFLPTATVLSAVPPAVVKLQLRDLGATGSVVGRLSAWGTAGALFGTFVTGFVLVAAAAVTTLIVTVGLLLVAAGVAFAIAARADRTDAAAGPLYGAFALAALSLVGVTFIDSPCERQTAYYCLDVDADPVRSSGRILWLDDVRHSYVDLDDPEHLEFWYVRRLVDAIDTQAPPGPLDVVHVGGGGLTLPRHLRATRPGSDQTVLEIDEALVEVATDRLGFEPGPDVEIVVDDARLSLRRLPDDSADVVVGDAFGSRSVPYHLATREFLDDVGRVLRADGLYVANVIDGGRQRFLRAEVATISAVFEHVALVRGPGLVAGGNANAVIVASDSQLDLDGLAARLVDEATGAGSDVEATGELVGEVRSGADLDDFVAGADVLTDDFAPVDQLISG